MKTLIKLILVAVVLHAVARGGLMAWSYYKFRDSTQQLITFGSQVPPSQLRNQVLEMGWELGLPVAAEDVFVEREGIRTTAGARYVQEFEFFPNNFRPIDLDFVVDTYSIYPGVQEDP